MIVFKNKTVAEKYIAKAAEDVKINMRGYIGNLSNIHPLGAATLAARGNQYLEPKPAEKPKKNNEPG